MNRYDRDIRSSTRRKDDDGANGCLSAIIIFVIFAALLGIVIAFATDSRRQISYRRTMDSMSHTYTSDGSMIKVYVITDPDTNVQYVVSDRGGICVREKNVEQ